VLLLPRKRLQLDLLRLIVILKMAPNAVHLSRIKSLRLDYENVKDDFFLISFSWIVLSISFLDLLKELFCCLIYKKNIIDYLIKMPIYLIL
jgi:hypothetical protein